MTSFAACSAAVLAAVLLLAAAPAAAQSCGVTEYRNGSACAACPPHSRAGARGGTAISDCACEAGWYGPAGGTCTVCPFGADCPAGSQTPRAAAGFWTPAGSPDDRQFVRCPLPQACPAGSSCASGYSGALCASCTGEASQLLGSCASCATAGWTGIVGLLALLLLLPVALLALLWAAAPLEQVNWTVNGVREHVARRDAQLRRAELLGHVRAGIIALQLAGLLAYVDLPWPDVVRGALHVARLFTLDVFATLAPDCMFAGGATARLLGRLLTPLVPLLLLPLYAKLWWAVLEPRFGGDKSKKQQAGQVRKPVEKSVEMPRRAPPVHHEEEEEMKEEEEKEEEEKEEEEKEEEEKEEGEEGEEEKEGEEKEKDADEEEQQEEDADEHEEDDEEEGEDDAKAGDDDEEDKESDQQVQDKRAAAAAVDESRVDIVDDEADFYADDEVIEQPLDKKLAASRHWKAACSFWLSLTFTATAVNAFAMFDCVKVSKGVYLLEAEPSIACYDDGFNGTFVVMGFIAVIIGALVVVASVYSTIIARRRLALALAARAATEKGSVLQLYVTTLPPQELAPSLMQFYLQLVDEAVGVAETADASCVQDWDAYADHLQTHHALSAWTYGYAHSPAGLSWEALSQLRRGLWIAIMLLLTPYPEAQAGLGLLLLACFLVAQARSAPFASKELSTAEVGQSSLLALLLFAALLQSAVAGRQLAPGDVGSGFSAFLQLVQVVALFAMYGMWLLALLAHCALPSKSTAALVSRSLYDKLLDEAELAVFGDEQGYYAGDIAVDIHAAAAADDEAHADSAHDSDDEFVDEGADDDEQLSDLVITLSGPPAGYDEHAAAGDGAADGDGDEAEDSKSGDAADGSKREDEDGDDELQAKKRRASAHLRWRAGGRGVIDGLRSRSGSALEREGEWDGIFGRFKDLEDKMEAHFTVGDLVMADVQDVLRAEADAEAGQRDASDGDGDDGSAAAPAPTSDVIEEEESGE